MGTLKCLKNRFQAISCTPLFDDGGFPLPEAAVAVLIPKKLLGIILDLVSM